MIDTTYVNQSGLRVSAIKVQDPTPFGRANVKKDTLRFGSLVEAHTDGNWRQ
jgi:dTDP-glucose pyrophosphorylase